MHYTIELLVQGNGSVLEFYANAVGKWNEIVNSEDFVSVESLSRRVSIEQIPFFENQCGGRWVGQEIMCVVGIGQFYSTETGFGTNVKSALKIYDAIMRSSCSLEVKGHARRVAESYDLLEYRNA